jgi:hypothetical protein
MATYLLLRDNKQTGPFSLEEIKAIGFKKYDLVWIEGKSAAWRYPGEIAEFKELAPIVEEQPFDRFFKKPSQESASRQTEQTSKESPKKDNTPKQAIAEVVNKKVYTDLPKKRGANAVPTQKLSPYSGLNKKNAPVEPQKQTAQIKAETPTPTRVEEPIIQTQRAEIKPPKQRFNFSNYSQQILLGCCVLALLAAGIFIGLSIKKTNELSNSTNKAIEANKDADKSINTQPQFVSLQTDHEQGSNEKTTKETLDNSATSSGTDELNKGNENGSTQRTKKLGTEPSQNKDASLKEKTGNSLPEKTNATDKNSKKDTNSSYLQIPHREATYRNNGASEKETSKQTSIENLVAVSTNKYTIGTFGGISELQLTVNNKSNYPLDMVTVEVRYVQSNKKVFKTENIYFRNIKPGESIMNEAPNSTRGIRVEYKIKSINSKESSITYSGT